jgi:hypothetical protein
MRFPSIAMAAAILLAAGGVAAACQGTTILFQDSFDRLQPTWGEASDVFKVVDSRLEVSPAADSYHWAANSANLYDDIDMCVTMTTTAINELRVTTVGSNATFHVNGSQFEELEGSPPENGQQIGLFAASPPSGAARFGFDNLKITKP